MKISNRQHGYSILELSLVLFLLALASFIALPRLGAVLVGGRAEGALRTLTETIHYARSTAAVGAQDLFLHLDLREGKYWLSRDPSLISEPEYTEDLAEIHRLPAGVKFKEVTTLGRGRVAEGRVTVRFFPDGTVETADLHIEDRDSREFTLSIHPLTGSVHVEEKYIVQKGLG